MQKVEFNRENLEKEGYTLRVEDGITYIEKEDKKNHSKYGICFSFFQQKIELDIKGQEIVTLTNILYKKEPVNETNIDKILKKEKEKKLESTVIVLEGENSNSKLIEHYDENGKIIYSLKVNNRSIERTTSTKIGFVEEFFDRTIRKTTLKIDGVEIPILKIDGVEIPILKNEKYKEICKEFEISPLSKLIEKKYDKKLKLDMKEQLIKPLKKQL